MQLLQALTSEQVGDLNHYAIIIPLYIIGFLIAVFITRWIFSIGIIVKHMKEQTDLLKSIASKINEVKDYDVIK